MVCQRVPSRTVFQLPTVPKPNIYPLLAFPLCLFYFLYMLTPASWNQPSNYLYLRPCLRPSRKHPPSKKKDTRGLGIKAVLRHVDSEGRPIIWHSLKYRKAFQYFFSSMPGHSKGKRHVKDKNDHFRMLEPYIIVLLLHP